MSKPFKKLEELISKNIQDTDRKIQEIQQLIVENRKNSDREIREGRRQIGDLAKTLGLWVEAIAAPAILTYFAHYYGPIIDHYLRLAGAANGHSREEDIILIAEKYLIIIEVKSKLNDKTFDDFLEDFTKDQIQKYYPHFAAYLESKELLGGLAGMVIPNNLKNRIEKRGLFLFGPADEQMECLFDPKRDK